MNRVRHVRKMKHEGAARGGALIGRAVRGAKESQHAILLDVARLLIRGARAPVDQAGRIIVERAGKVNSVLG